MHATLVSTEFLLLGVHGIASCIEVLHHTIGTAEHYGTFLCTGDFAKTGFDYGIVTNKTFIWNAAFQWGRGCFVVIR